MPQFLSGPPWAGDLVRSLPKLEIELTLNDSGLGSINWTYLVLEASVNLLLSCRHAGNVTQLGAGADLWRASEPQQLCLKHRCANLLRQIYTLSLGHVWTIVFTLKWSHPVLVLRPLTGQQAGDCLPSCLCVPGDVSFNYIVHPRAKHREASNASV